MRTSILLTLVLLAASCGDPNSPNSNNNNTQKATNSNKPKTVLSVSTYEVVKKYPHDPKAFTQGLRSYCLILPFYESPQSHGAERVQIGFSHGRGAKQDALRVESKYPCRSPGDVLSKKLSYRPPQKRKAKRRKKCRKHDQQQWTLCVR